MPLIQYDEYQTNKSEKIKKVIEYFAFGNGVIPDERIKRHFESSANRLDSLEKKISNHNKTLTSQDDDRDTRPPPDVILLTLYENIWKYNLNHCMSVADLGKWIKAVRDKYFQYCPKDCPLELQGIKYYIQYEKFKNIKHIPKEIQKISEIANTIYVNYIAEQIASPSDINITKLCEDIQNKISNEEVIDKEFYCQFIDRLKFNIERNGINEDFVTRFEQFKPQLSQELVEEIKKHVPKIANLYKTNDFDDQEGGNLQESSLGYPDVSQDSVAAIGDDTDASSFEI